MCPLARDRCPLAVLRLATGLTPELRIDQKTRKKLFHYQLWCPKFRRFNDRYNRRRCHCFGGPKSFFVSARQSILGVGIINALSLNQKHASILDCISDSYWV